MRGRSEAVSRKLLRTGLPKASRDDVARIKEVYHWPSDSSNFEAKAKGYAANCLDNCCDCVRS